MVQVVVGRTTAFPSLVLPASLPVTWEWWKDRAAPAGLLGSLRALEEEEEGASIRFGITAVPVFLIKKRHIQKV